MNRILTGTYGKIPLANAHNIQMMEQKHFFNLLSYYLPGELAQNEDFKAFIRDDSLISTQEYADVILMSLPTPRVTYYESTNYEDILRAVTIYSN